MHICGMLSAYATGQQAEKLRLDRAALRTTVLMINNTTKAFYTVFMGNFNPRVGIQKRSELKVGTYTLGHMRDSEKF